MVRTKSQLENISKKELVEKLISVEDISSKLPVVSMIFREDMKFFLLSYQLVKTASACQMKKSSK